MSADILSTLTAPPPGNTSTEGDTGGDGSQHGGSESRQGDAMAREDPNDAEDEGEPDEEGADAHQSSVKNANIPEDDDETLGMLYPKFVTRKSAEKFGLPEGTAFGGESSRPIYFKTPPAHGRDDDLQVVGVPASTAHRDGNVFLRNGYGGLEVLMHSERLSTREMAVLYDLCAGHLDLRDFILTPRPSSLSDGDLHALLDSVAVKREIASLVSEYGPENLAQRVFGTVSALRKVIQKCIRMQSLLENRGPDLVNVGRVHDELAELRRDYQLVTSHLDFRHAEAVSEREDALQNAPDDIKHLMEEHDRDKRGLRKQVEELTKRLDDARVQNRLLEHRLQTSAFSAIDVMNFLNAGKGRSTVTVNWQRLLDLLKNFQNGTNVPSEWHTVISVIATDDPGHNSAHFVEIHRPREGDDGDTKEGDPPSYLDLSRGSSITPASGNPSSKSSSKRKRSTSGFKSSKKNPRPPDVIQSRPSEWIKHSDGNCRSDKYPLVWTERQARESWADYPRLTSGSPDAHDVWRQVYRGPGVDSGRP